MYYSDRETDVANLTGERDGLVSDVSRLTGQVEECVTREKELTEKFEGEIMEKNNELQ